MNTQNIVRRAVGLLTRKTREVQRLLHAPALVRPTLLLQSDDWGRTGMPDPGAVAALQAGGISLSASPWDRFGLESADDLTALGDLLLAHTDVDGNPAVMSAVFVMANADLFEMQAEDYRRFRAVPIHQGFPAPWQQEPLIGIYNQLIDSRVFYPALHGYTHFNPQLMLSLAREDSERGARIRLLHAQGIPYLVSLTPEFNFALLDRSGATEQFIGAAEQADWIEQGVHLFQLAFGRQPYSTCAPGYRFDVTTCKLWQQAGLSVVHNAGGMAGSKEGLWHLARNVFFEQALDANALPTALQAADAAVARGEPIVVCTHSINYVSRHVGLADEGRKQLAALLVALLQRYPDLRFTDEQQLHQSWLKQDQHWWRASSSRERLARFVR